MYTRVARSSNDPLEVGHLYELTYACKGPFKARTARTLAEQMGADPRFELVRFDYDGSHTCVVQVRPNLSENPAPLVIGVIIAVIAAVFFGFLICARCVKIAELVAPAMEKAATAAGISTSVFLVAGLALAFFWALSVLRGA